MTVSAFSSIQFPIILALALRIMIYVNYSLVLQMQKFCKLLVRIGTGVSSITVYLREYKKFDIIMLINVESIISYIIW